MIFDGTLLWLVAVAAVVLWIPQNFAHEAAHGLAARHWGATITKLWPFPGTSLGYFTFAHIRWEWGSVRPESIAMGIISAAPQIANTMVLSFVIALRWRFPDMPEVLASILGAWALVNFADGAVNLSTFYRLKEKPTTDGWSWLSRFSLLPWQGRTITVLWQAWFGFHVLIPTTLV